MGKMYKPGEETTYSRDEAVSAFTSFYEWLVKLYLPASALKYPPPGGWPEISPEYLAFLKKNDTVVDLLRHLPYIQRDEEFNPYQIYEKTSAVDYNGNYFRNTGVNYKNPVAAEPYNVETVLPSHVATIAKTAAGRDGYFFFLDTERGTMTMCDFQVGPKRATGLEQEIPKGSGETWREHQTYKIKDFFEMLKEDFEDFEVIPFSPTQVEMTRRCGGYDIDKLAEVYRAYGWPSENYKKEECMKALEKVVEEVIG